MYVYQVSVHLTFWTSLYKLAAIYLYSQPKVTSSHDFTSQHVTSHVWSTNSYIDLSHPLYDVARSIHNTNMPSESRIDR